MKQEIFEQVKKYQIENNRMKLSDEELKQIIL